MAKVHPNAAVPFREMQTLGDFHCGGGDDEAGRRASAAVLTVWRKSLLFGCSGFTVFDAKGNLAFRVDVYGGSGTVGTLVLMDAAGKPLLTVRRKKLSLGENWVVHNGEDADDPLFSVKRYVNLLQSKALAHVAPCRRRRCRGTSAGCGGVEGYEVEGSYSRRSCAVYDGRRRAVAEIQRKETVGGVALGVDVFRLVVQPDIDTCLAMAIVIVLDQMFR